MLTGMLEDLAARAYFLWGSPGNALLHRAVRGQAAKQLGAGKTRIDALAWPEDAGSWLQAGHYIWQECLPASPETGKQTGRLARIKQLGGGTASGCRALKGSAFRTCKLRSSYSIRYSVYLNLRGRTSLHDLACKGRASHKQQRPHVYQTVCTVSTGDAHELQQLRMSAEHPHACPEGAPTIQPGRLHFRVCYL